MRRTIGLLLASGLALLVAGCASTSKTAAPAAGGSQAAAAETSGQSVSLRNFNLRVKCPGVNTLKQHGWTDEQITAQLNLEPGDIPACEKWVQEQPKGYVPPPPPGVVRKTIKLPATPGAAPASGTSTTGSSATSTSTATEATKK